MISKFTARIKFPTWTVPLVLLGLALASFGLLVPKLGFYWDDWAKILVSRVYGLSGYWAYYAEDRPLSAWTHILLTPLLGQAPLGWQIFTLSMRWLSAWAMYWCLSSLWPGRRFQAAAASSLFLVYPVFTQQSIALTFHQQWMQFALFFLSLGLMILSVRKPRYFWWLTLLSILTNAVQLSITEYFIGLEFLRPVVFWLLARQQQPGFWKQIRLVFLRWYPPYLVMLAGYLAYRLFFIRLTSADPYQAVTLYQFFQDPAGTLLWLVKTIWIDSTFVLFSNWSRVLDLGYTQNIPRFTWLALGVGALAAVGLFFYLLRWRDQEAPGEPEKDPPVWEAFLLGGAALLFGPISAWITGRQIVFDFHSSRYALPALFGASLLLVAAIEMVSTRRWQRAFLVSVLIGLAVTFNLRTGNQFRWDWDQQLGFYWQLAWRAPGLQPQTTIVAEKEFFPDDALFSISSALNLLYPNPHNPEKLSYWMYTLLPKYSESTSAQVSTVQFNTRFRTLSYHGSAANSLLVYNQPDRSDCLWILTAADRDNPYLSAVIKNMLPLSNLSRIQTEPPQLEYSRELYFGPEPEHSWCYLFEKAELAAQQKDWPAVQKLAEQAQQQGFGLDIPESGSPREWMAFIDGALHSGDWETGRALTLASYRKDDHYARMLCSLWKQAQSETGPSPEKDPAARNISIELSCSAGN